MSYMDAPAMSKNRQTALVWVTILHVLLGYAIVSGFAISVVKKIVEPLEAVNVKEEAPPPDEPPPPPPKEIEIPPYVPPPEVSIASDAPTNSITTQSTVARPDPPSWLPRRQPPRPRLLWHRRRQHRAAVVMSSRMTIIPALRVLPRKKA